MSVSVKVLRSEGNLCPISDAWAVVRDKSRNPIMRSMWR